jgi:hypothetical protein
MSDGNGHRDRDSLVILIVFVGLFLVVFLAAKKEYTEASLKRKLLENQVRLSEYQIRHFEKEVEPNTPLEETTTTVVCDLGYRFIYTGAETYEMVRVEKTLRRSQYDRIGTNGLPITGWGPGHMAIGFTLPSGEVGILRIQIDARETRSLMRFIGSDGVEFGWIIMNTHVEPREDKVFVRALPREGGIIF